MSIVLSIPKFVFVLLICTSNGWMNFLEGKFVQLEIILWLQLLFVKNDHLFDSNFLIHRNDYHFWVSWGFEVFDNSFTKRNRLALSDEWPSIESHSVLTVVA